VFSLTISYLFTTSFRNMPTIAIFVLAILPLAVSAAPVLQNITITVPEGTSNNGDPHLLCIPARSWDMLVFIATNYIAHSATVKALPGEPAIPTFLTVLLALLFPVTGVIRGLDAIFQAAVFQKTPLDTAVRAGAVCEVVRTSFWRPETGDLVKNIVISPSVEVPAAAGPAYP
jgi:hypothetical protein